MGFMDAYGQKTGFADGLSNEAKGSLPLDLTSKQHLNSLIVLLCPLIVPPILANGQQST